MNVLQLSHRPADIGNEEKLAGVARRIEERGRKVITIKVDVSQLSYPFQFV